MGCPVEVLAHSSSATMQVFVTSAWQLFLALLGGLLWDKSPINLKEKKSGTPPLKE